MKKCKKETDPIVFKSYDLQSPISIPSFTFLQKQKFRKAHAVHPADRQTDLRIHSCSREKSLSPWARLARVYAVIMPPFNKSCLTIPGYTHSSPNSFWPRGKQFSQHIRIQPSALHPNLQRPHHHSSAARRFCQMIAKTSDRKKDYGTYLFHNKQRLWNIES